MSQEKKLKVKELYHHEKPHEMLALNIEGKKIKVSIFAEVLPNGTERIFVSRLKEDNKSTIFIEE